MEKLLIIGLGILVLILVGLNIRKKARIRRLANIILIDRSKLNLYMYCLGDKSSKKREVKNMIEKYLRLQKYVVEDCVKIKEFKDEDWKINFNETE